MNESRSPWAIGSFRALAVANAVNSFGDALSFVALPLLVFRATGRAVDMSILLLIEFGCVLLFGPLLSACIDRYNRKALIFWSLSGQGLGMLGIATFQAFYGIWPIYLLVVWINALYAISRPAIQAYTKDILPDDGALLNIANSHSDSLSDFIKLFGASLAGVIMQSHSPGIAFLLDSISFFLVAAIVLMLTHSQRSQIDAKKGGHWERTIHGFKIIRQNATLMSMIWIAGIVGALQGLFVTSYIFHIKTTLRFTDMSVAILVAVEGFALAAGKLIPSINRLEFLNRKAHLPALGITVAFGSMALFSSFSLYSFSLAVVCIGIGFLIVTTRTLCQKLAPSADQGKILALRMTVVHGGAFISAAATGPVLDYLSSRILYWGACVISALLVGMLYGIYQQKIEQASCPATP